MKKKVFIFSIPRETASRIHDWTNDSSGKRMKKTKIGRCRDTIVALYDSRVGGLRNGLSYKPWTENGKRVTDSNGKPLTLQQREEQKWGLEPDYLSNRPWRRGDSLDPEQMTYYQRASWKVNDGSTVLDLENFDDAMFYYVALDSKYIANSESEWRSHKWPKAQWYIALENEAEELKFQKNKVKSEAFAALHDKNMTPTAKMDFVIVLELASAFANLTEEQTHNLLFDYIDKSDFREGSNIDKFIELFSLLKNAAGREELAARKLLKTALDSRVVYEKQGSYTWNKSTGAIIIGETYTEAINFLLNPKKQALVEELEEEIRLKTM